MKPINLDKLIPTLYAEDRHWHAWKMIHLLEKELENEDSDWVHDSITFWEALL